MKKSIALILLLFLTACSADLGSDSLNPIVEKELTISQKLENKAPAEKANIKGIEIAKAVSLDTAIYQKEVQRTKYKIEIVEIKEIKGGVEVFVRAWNEKGQIGFGKDGSVDIERFRIFNPPVLVDDPNGDIVKEWEEENPGGKTVTRTRTLREDPKEALLQVIEHNLSVMKNIHGSKNIVAGKRGNTTSTFYSGSGDLAISSYTTTWSAARAGTGTTVEYAPGNDFSAMSTGYWSPNFYVTRLFLHFDTSSIGSGEDISEAAIYLFRRGSSDNDNDGYDYINVYQSTVSANDTIDPETDFNNVGDTPFSTAIDLTSGASGNVSFTLNASGIANINKTGWSKFSFREGHDVDNHPYKTANGFNEYQPYISERTGTTADPKLVVEHSAGASAPDTSQIIWFD